MVVGGYVFAIGIIALVALVIRHQARQAKADRVAGAVRFGICRLEGGELYVGGGIRRTYAVTPATRAEVIGAPQDVRRSTLTRTVAGGVVAGPVGALAGHAAKKKVKTNSVVLTINGDDWTQTIPVPGTEYAQAVRFAQAINLAARNR